MPTPDAEDRRRARLELARNVVVEAGAGTGKTTLLADRILFTLLAGGAKGKGSDVTRVVALTFTEKAAGEIKERLHQRLLDLLARIEGRELPKNRAAVADQWLADARERWKKGDEEVVAMARAALGRLDRAMVMTIHGFAAWLLRRHPLEAGVDPGFAVDEGAAFEEAFAAAWALHLDAELGTAAPHEREWVALLQRADLGELEALARDLASEAAQQAAAGTAAEVRARLNRLVASVEGILKLEKPKPHGSSKINERLPELLERLEALSRPAPDLDPAPVLSPYKKSSWPKAWDAVPGKEDFEAACRLVETCDPQGLSLTLAAQERVAAASAAVRAELARRGRVGFDALLARARDLVRDQPEVRELLKRQFDAILVDEFQDTDPLQGELLLFLAERPGGKARSWREVEPQAGRLFVVGDPKQSIYRFRGADIRAYESFTEHLKSHGALPCDLSTNFRSHEGLVSPVNAVFARILSYEEYLQPAYKPLSPAPGKKGPDGPAVRLVLTCHPEAEDGKVDAEASAEAQARWAARWIKDSGRSPKDVAMLFRTAARMRPFVLALKEAGIRFAVEAEGAYFGAPEVVDFLALLRVLADPEDKVSMAALLRSPLAAVEDRELLALAEAKALDYRSPLRPGLLPAAALQRVTTLYGQLASLSKNANKEPLGRFVTRALTETFLLENSAAAYHGEQAPANLLKLARLAQEAGEADGLTLREFSLRAAELAEDDAEGESPLADEGVDAVRLLTIHKAKGLEFPVVFLPELARGASKSAPPGVLYDWGTGSLGLRVGDAKDVSWFVNDELRKKREEREKVRLLYVAMTRAKEEMVLMGNAAPKREAGDGFHALLREAGVWPQKGEHPEDPPFPITWLTAAPAVAGEKPAAPAPVDAGRLAALWERRLEEFKALDGKPAFSQPSAHDGEWEGPSAAEEALPRERARVVGTVCHKVLELWDYGKGGDLPAMVDAACALLGADVRDEAAGILAAFVKSPAAEFLAGVEILGREVPYVRRLADGTVERGAMDLLYKKDGRVWVADYKTGSLSGAEKKWGAQGRAYCAAVGEGAGFAVVGLKEGRVVEIAA